MGTAGAAGAETMTDWEPAVEPLEQTTTTVYVPGLTPDQAADWLMVVPDRAACRPWAKFAWRLLSSEALPQLPLFSVHELVTTETVDPVVLTEIPEAAADGPASEAGSAAAAARVRPERRRSREFRIGWPPAARLAVRPMRRRGSGNVRAASRAAKASPVPAARGTHPAR
ncbi:hypothetical protein Scel_81780 [Streptomyces cellostaticus]|nr:hypothetical protein Scel_81780 [Streptomyces cellostaticus]